MKNPKTRNQPKVRKPIVAKVSRGSREDTSEKPKRLYEQIIFRDWCKSCGICSEFCPKHVIGLDENHSPVIERPDECIGCRFCELHCPDFAITIRQRNGKPEENSR